MDFFAEFIRYLVLFTVSLLICTNLKPEQIGIAAGALCGFLIGGLFNAAILAFAVHFLHAEAKKGRDKKNLPPTE